MRYFMDTEFIEDGKTIELLSIGIVAEDGRELYVEVVGIDTSRADQWVKDNVIAHLWHRQLDKREFNRWVRDGVRGGLLPLESVAGEILRFVAEGESKPEFWGYYADYDWVVFCQLFGRMIDLPKGFPMYCRDIKQWADVLGVRLPKQTEGEHNALNDARWNRDMYDFLIAAEAAPTLSGGLPEDGD